MERNLYDAITGAAIYGELDEAEGDDTLNADEATRLMREERDATLAVEEAKEDSEPIPANDDTARAWRALAGWGCDNPED